MSNTPHELAEEFPAHVEIMHNLKTEDAHFGRLFDEYHEINRTIHRAETNVEPTDDFNEEAMRKKRMVLKYQIWAILSKA
ncbi:MAG: DUF465 domain-containing protein [Proteobacteria bacterium]|nr:DUF465 domain-containing protein [Pseudomonadota bacterium]MDA1285716.1 DUF465 domain-containing protein [Pseudomonadota bacterium]